MAAHQSPVWPKLIRRAQERVHSLAPSPATVVATGEENERLWGLNPRTILSIARTVIYLGLLIFLALRPAAVTGPLDAGIYGAVFVDYLTWFIWSFVMLPRHIWHGGYEALINLGAGLALTRSWPVQLHDDIFAEAIAMMFVCFMVVVFAKVFCLGLTLMNRALDDDL